MKLQLKVKPAAAEVLKIVVAVQAGKSVRKCGNLWCRQAGHTKATCQTMKPLVGAAAAGGAAAAIAPAPIAAGDFDSDDDGEASSDEEGGDDGAVFYDEGDDSAGFEDEGIGGAPISSYASSGILPAPPVATGPLPLAADVRLVASNMALPGILHSAVAVVPRPPRPDLAVGVRVRLNLIRTDDLDILLNDRGSPPIQGCIVAVVRGRTFVVEWLTGLGQPRPRQEYAAARLYALLR